MTDPTPSAAEMTSRNAAASERTVVDCVVVGFHSSDTIRDCLTQLLSDAATRQIVLVDNSADPATRDCISDLSRVSYIENRINVGYGSGVNCARPLISCEFIALVNPDAIAQPDTVSECVAFLREHPRAGIVAPRMITPSGDLYRNSQYLLTLPRLILNGIGYPALHRSLDDHARPHMSAYVIGSFWVCRRSCLDDVGWFDESIFLFGEDADVCRRVRKKGWEVWFAPIGLVVHQGGHSWRQLSDQGRKDFLTARARELRLNGGRWQEWIYRALTKITDPIRRRR